jgi:GNAT superfamily N-acetyltransferase
MSLSLPDGFSVRSVTPTDAQAVNELVVTADEAVMGWSDSTEVDLLDWWRLVDLERDSWVVEDGSIAAYGVLYGHGETADLDCYVDPARKGLGLGSWLLEHAEARASERRLPRAHAWALADDVDAHRLFDTRGYREVRRYYRMFTELDGPPPDVVWPDGLRVETCATDDARAFHAAVNTAFAEEWNWVPLPFEQWYERHAEAPDFDPKLWFVVRDGDEIAAVLRGEPERFGAGWIGAIGVLEPWRRRGIGLALLQHAFGEFYRRGQRRIGLGVDAQNPTGATRLYERAGMHVAYAAIAFEKELG